VSGDDIKLPSGSEIYANRGFIGINADLELSQGYDGEVYIPTPDWDDYSTVKFDAKDARDLADIMIALWVAFKEKHS
jgi:hypothetical protein